MNDEAPSVASLLRRSGQVTHFKNSRGWIETPDGRFFKPEPSKVQFIDGKNKPYISANINKCFLRGIAEFLRKRFK
ncbi:hypothetical protein GTGU_04101 [Trabulsiella guamensis ATCC 49490]|uniref:DUF2724 domain-containing protein n=1 Tax=Trabulsiella guamensis ATCC 49490 TaxID=1005994 RepID=A0A084ZQB8_9ENTR|nr:phage filamentation protein Fil family protein [Trabulsiella guamensis]KFB99662.1 hypothetical protein GTGU_04101 [Trabulsiella guamensis ATCC 49490]